MRHWAIICLLFPWLLVQSRPAIALSDPIRAKITPARFAIEPFAVETDPILEALNGLVAEADLIVRGRVTTLQSYWSTDRSMIESTVSIEVDYQVVGDSAPVVTVRTPGGYLAEEGLGMVSAHAASFAVGEEVLLLLHATGSDWQMADGAAGKFLIQGEIASNPDLAQAWSLDELLSTMVESLDRRGVASQLPANWREREREHLPAAQLVVATPMAARKWATPHAAAPFYVNLNSEQVGNEDGDYADFRNAIIAAAARWSGVEDADFALTYAGETGATQTGYNGVNEVLFMHKGPKERAAAAQAWYTADQTIVEADIWINDDYRWNATGAPAANEVDLQSALLHEFGHWLILGHYPETEAVMFGRLSAGVLKRDLQAPDVAGIRAIYPR